MSSVFFTPGTLGVVGGVHSWAHAAVKIILANGGNIFTRHEVDKVIIESGKATGVRLTDGTEVEARKLVVSTLDPYTLCFRLIGKEHLDWQILRKVENLERRLGTPAYYHWALQEPPNYKAASINPDINETMMMLLISNDPHALVREHAIRTLGRMPDDLQLIMINYSLMDKTRVPTGKSCVLTGQFVLPANALTEREWMEFKSSHAEQVIKLWQEHAPNMSWDNVIGYLPHTPYDSCKLANMAPTGCFSVIDNVASQLGRFRPIPELANHRTPIKNLYATGAAWPPFGMAGASQGYNCYKVVAQDLELEKPWEEGGHPW